jgi:hypothetical protein
MNDKELNQAIKERGNRDLNKTLDLASNEIDPRYFRPGYDYRMVRMNISGEDDYNLEGYLTKGWTLVPKNRVKDANHYQDPFGRDSMTKDYVCRKDCILVERDKELGDIEKTKQYHTIDQIKNKLYASGRVQEDFTN